MRLILEKEEIVTILSKHFDAELDPTKVVIRTDPLEIEVHGLPLSSNDPPPKKVRGLEAVPQLQEKKEEGASSASDDVHPAALLAASKSIERELNSEKAKRRSGQYSYDPPAVSDDEMT